MTNAVFDFTGTDAQRAGNVNAVEAVTVSAVAFAIRVATDPSMPANGGAMRPVRVIAQPGTVVAAVPPVAVGAGNVEVSQRVADVCLAALAQAVPDRVGAAGQGTMNNVLIGGDGWVYYETIGGGQGARPWADGMSGVHTAMTNTLDTPVEALERDAAGAGAALHPAPWERRRRRVPRRRRHRARDRGARARHRVAHHRAAHECAVGSRRRRSRCTGGELAASWGDDADAARRLPDKCTVDVAAGDVIRILTPGGGGWGPPR